MPDPRALLLVLLVLTGASIAESPPPPPPPSLVLLTLDTTRSDFLGSYGAANAVTPHLDDVARRGTLYARALTPAPLTLPAHASLLTGQELARHAILDNGTAVLDPSFPTLATVLHERGYATGAFVASRVLDRRFGLDRGFEVYDDRMTAELVGEYGYPERGAEAVTSAALAWLAGVASSRPFFLWAHYYDPHAPYEAPGATPRERYAGEIARMDAEIGRLLAAISRQRKEGFVIAAVGDHGESLGEHGERTHGLFLYRASLEVPLLVAGPGVEAGRRVEETVASRRLAATLLRLLGTGDASLPGPPLPGLPSLGEDPPPEAVYSATWMPASAYGWARLAAVSDQRWRLVRAPRSELYDYAADPGETTNLVRDAREEAGRLAAELETFEAGLGERRAPAAELDTRLAADLRSLGYVTSGAPSDGGTIDPKDGIALLADFERAKRLLRGGDAQGARRQLEALVAKNPRNVPFLRQLAQTQLASGRAEEALKTYGRAIELNPRLDFLHLNLAEACQRLGRLDAARAAYRRTLELNPRAASAWLGLAEMAALAGGAAEERRLLEEAVAAGTASAAVRIRLGQVTAGAGEVEAAGVHFRTATELAPEWALAWLSRGRLLLRAGRSGEGRRCLEKAAALSPGGAEGREARRLLQGLPPG